MERDEKGNYFRIINGKKIIQIEEKTEKDKELNRVINEFRASGMKLSDYMKTKLRS